MVNMTSAFQSRERIRFKQQIEEDLYHIHDMGLAIRRSKTKDEKLCCIKVFFEYIKNNPLLLTHHVGFRVFIMKRIKEEKIKMRIERVLAHQSYHKKRPSQRSHYEAELSRYVQPIEKVLHELEMIIKMIQ